MSLVKLNKIFQNKKVVARATRATTLRPRLRLWFVHKYCDIVQINRLNTAADKTNKSFPCKVTYYTLIVILIIASCIHD